MAGQQNQPKRHHYIAQFELEYFTDSTDANKRIWVYDRARKVYLQLTPLNFANENHLYSQENEAGEKDTMLETELMAKMDGRASAILRKLVGLQPLTRNERIDFAFHTALKMARVPRFREQLQVLSDAFTKTWYSVIDQSPGGLEKHITEFEKSTGNKLSAENRKKAIDMIRSGEYDIHPSKNTNLKSMLDITVARAPIIDALDWVVCKPPKGRAFVGSDVIEHFNATKPSPFRGVGLAAPGVETIVILTPYRVLLMKEGGGKLIFGSLSSSDVRAINCQVVAESSRFAFSHNEALLKRLVKVTNIENIDPPRATLEVVGGPYKEKTVFKSAKRKQ